MRKTVALLLFALCAVNAAAADRGRIRGFNIGAQAIVTLISSAVQGHLRGADVVRSLVAGSVAGYGFYEAKAMVGRGKTRRGWILANVAGSITENTAAGRSPWAQIGYSLGPIRIRVPLGTLDPAADSYLLVDASEYEAVRLIDAWRDNDRTTFRSGIIAFERDTVYARQGNLITVGRTWGMFPGVWRGTGGDVWAHEVIHAVQSLQADSVEPRWPYLSYEPRPLPDGRKRIIRFEHFKPGAFNYANARILGTQRYENRWMEIEAYRLAQDQSPTRTP